MLDDLIRKLPPGVVATIVIGLGIFLLLLLNPPHTACITQNELLVKDLTPLFFTKENAKLQNKKPPSLYAQYKKRCLRGTSQGACLAWFESLNKLDKSLINSPSECSSDALGLTEINQAINDGAELMVRLAWGSKAPESSFKRNSWLDSYHISSFCNMKDWYLSYKGDEAWAEFQENLMNELPGADALEREQRWKRSLFSTPCKRL